MTRNECFDLKERLSFFYYYEIFVKTIVTVIY